ncbi:MAG: hypothetical protein HC822_24290 [Oscillochloris sp.]|nr:hypothetical protein [Oscillochloris sp.]
MTRILGTTTTAITPVAVDTKADMRDWLKAQMETYGLTWLLLCLSEGMVWGVLEGSILHLSTDADAFPQSGPAPWIGKMSIMVVASVKPVNS